MLSQKSGQQIMQSSVVLEERLMDSRLPLGRYKAFMLGLMMVSISWILSGCAQATQRIDTPAPQHENSNVRQLATTNVDSTKIAENRLLELSTACPEKRNRKCHKNLKPVCAKRSKEVHCFKAPCPEFTEQVTYSNACTACADPLVKSHQPGPCEAGQSMPAMDSNYNK